MDFCNTHRLRANQAEITSPPQYLLQDFAVGESCGSLNALRQILENVQEIYSGSVMICGSAISCPQTVLQLRQGSCDLVQRCISIIESYAEDHIELSL